MVLVIYVLMLAIKVGMCAAHVYCQDEHATDYTPLGYSCPINCAAIVAAVKRLQEIDYEDLMKVQKSPFSPKALNMTGFVFHEITAELPHDIEPSPARQKEDEILNSSEQIRNEIGPRQLSPLHHMKLYKLLLNKRTGAELQKAFKHASSQYRNACQPVKKGKIKNYKTDKMCTRRSTFQEDFLEKFTEILNKHTESDFFTPRLTEIFLEKNLGDGADLRLGILDVQKILKQLRQAIASHKQHARAASLSITLKSKYCLNVYVPGCFCITGFVEQNGQCVRPPDCYPDPGTVREYLARIQVQ